MQAANISEKKLVRVICESCQQSADNHCEICGGSKFYFWDSETLLCYAADGKPLVAQNEAGEMVGVVRQTLMAAKNLDVATMLRFIELWVSEKPVRKWKLWIEKGWNCSVWPDRHKDKAQTFSAEDPERCIADCYRFVMTLIANPAD